MIDRYDFWMRPLILRRMMDRLFEDAFVLPAGAQSAEAGSRAMNVYQDGQSLVLEAHLPGVKPEDIDVTVEQGIVTVRCQANGDDEQKSRDYLVRQHRAESFLQSLRLPDSVDVDAARATFQHGVLRLTFPRTEQAQPRRVPISKGGPAAVTSAPGAETPVQSLDTPAPTAEQSADLPASHDGGAPKAEASNGPAVSGEGGSSETPQSTDAGSKAAKSKATDGRATGRRSTSGRANGRKVAAKAPAGVGA